MESKGMQIHEVIRGMNIEKRSIQALSPETLKHLAKTEWWPERLGGGGQAKTRSVVLWKLRGKCIAKESDQLC